MKVEYVAALLALIVLSVIVALVSRVATWEQTLPVMTGVMGIVAALAAPFERASP